MKTLRPGDTHKTPALPSMRRSLMAAALGLGLGFQLPAYADVPLTVREDGRIFDSSTNQPLNGTHTLTFQLYPSQTSAVSESVWSDVYQVVFSNGYFSVELGSQVPLEDALRLNGDLYLGIAVDSDAEFSPRNRLNSVPFAILAKDVTGIINPKSINIAGTPVIDAQGNWVGPSSGLAGARGATGATGATGPAGPAGAAGGGFGRLARCGGR